MMHLVLVFIVSMSHLPVLQVISINESIVIPHLLLSLFFMQFPSMASLQGALPNMTGNAPLLRSASLGTPLPQWMHLQQTPSYQMASSPSKNYGLLTSQSVYFLDANYLLLCQVLTWCSRA